MKFQPHAYQLKGVEHIFANRDTALLFMMGLGKQQPRSEPVLTPSGWKPIGGIEPGDKVIGSGGKPITVVSVHPQGVKPVYKMTLSDGTWVRSGPEHLWSVSSPATRADGRDNFVLSTSEIKEDIVYKNGNYKWAIPNLSPVVYSAKSKTLPVDPYVLGVILGDGSTDKYGGVTLCTDLEILQNIGARLLRAHDTSPYTWYGSLPGINRHIKSLGLAGSRAWEKFIPDSYLLSSPPERLALLQGLLDTDGHAQYEGGVEFSSTSEVLLDGVCELVRSLGGIARNKTTCIPKYQNGFGKRCWRVNIKMIKSLPPFRLKRKLHAWVPPTKYPPLRTIRKIEEILPEDSVCLEVDAPDNLYVTRDYILTHNTVTALSAYATLLDLGMIRGVLILAPIRVIHSVWRQEAEKWDHTKHLSFSLVHQPGPTKRIEALETKADFYLVNYEGVIWLTEWMAKMRELGRPLPWDAVIFDESSKMKDPSTRRFKLIKPYLRTFKWSTILTGSPAPNTLQDLWAQYYLLDQGETLGKYFGHYQSHYFTPVDRNGYQWALKRGQAEAIYRRISPLTIRLKNADKSLIPNISAVYADLPPALESQYKALEEEMFLDLEEGTVEVFNAAALASKCRQFAQGFLYIEDESGERQEKIIHDIKLDMLSDVVEEAGGSPVLIAYTFRADIPRIKAHLKKKHGMDVPHIGGGVSAQEGDKLIERWNRGSLPALLVHPQSIAHGVNLQTGGHILAWYGITWSLEEYEQLIARLARQGQKHLVSVLLLIVRGTIEEAVWAALKRKDKGQQALLNALQKYREEKESD